MRHVSVENSDADVNVLERLKNLRNVSRETFLPIDRKRTLPARCMDGEAHMDNGRLHWHGDFAFNPRREKI